jgi:hypothetical protein
MSAGIRWLQANAGAGPTGTCAEAIIRIFNIRVLATAPRGPATADMGSDRLAAE